MRLIDEILDRRRLSDRYDEQLWDFVGSLAKRPLEQVTDDALQVRLDQIEQNIQYLDTGFVGRDQLPPERGWISPWWWFRLRHWTLTEMNLRSLPPLHGKTIDRMPQLRPEFAGNLNGGPPRLVRIRCNAHR